MSTAVAERLTMDDYIRQVIDTAPPMSDETRTRIVELFRTGERR